MATAGFLPRFAGMGATMTMPPFSVSWKSFSFLLLANAIVAELIR
ncbi:hypothetical protein ACLB1M_31625 [Escherichia coli]